MNRLVIILLVLFPVITAAQECDCSSNFEWAKQTFEENDAGFSYVIDQKGEEAYAGHTEIFIERVKGVENVAECAEIILEWLGFFRSGHLSIRALNTGDSSAGDQLSDEEIRASFSEWERLEIDVPEFEQYLERKEEHDFEGIWVSEPYKVGIKKMGDKYIGFIIEADGVYWTPGQIKLRIQEDLSTTYYMRDHSARNFEMAELIGNNHLMMGFITFERVRPTLAPQPEIESYFRSIAAQDPYFEQINDQTTLLRIPSFSYSEKSKIDSVILTNKELILQTPNLIIDLRNNGGGSDGSFEELLPILYTNPIRTIGVEMLSTPLNNQRMLDFVNDDDYGFDEEEKKWAQDAYDKLSERIGEFVMLDEFPVSVTRFDTISEFPENIGVIVHEYNGSTTEQFLLAAKQSKKVKLFGTTTSGVLDISNMYFVRSPCEDLELAYSLSRSMRIPHMTIDEKGIQPDYYIDDEIPNHEWVQYVSDILNQ